ncbi:uncharacterized protein BO66DRAFT_429410 [Aspergillus aculeatinus CBS 121060]|uniref:Uncharacterized protein n=1 Tax=Aspergillus aculeatinus CBS 121060 TaxID=1448322 RepID=A0ACD1H6X3_9EURO|nr:hypothetical protein BO66DRAFT_429410 [Aspergillus aculeatinus CBS 121060]RAH69338.1 hypothetical protein BO66DRAFT_429410 [Aspergillus aculeatinus CBS 121060]
MCHPTCDADNTPRQKWVEIATQVLYAHNYLPGLAVAFCRSPDMYLWGRWRLGGSLRTRQKAFTTLASIHDFWFRLDDQASSVASDSVDVDEEKQQQQQQHQQVEKEGEALVLRASPTPMYKLDLVVWSYILGSVLNVGLAVCMWALNRSTRPYWLPGCLALPASVVITTGGVIIRLEQRRARVHASSHRNTSTDAESIDSETTYVERTDSEWTDVESTDGKSINAKTRGKEQVRAPRKDPRGDVVLVLVKL